MSLFDHVALVVSDYARAKAFYDSLAPLDVKVMDLGAKGCGYGRDQVELLDRSRADQLSEARAPADHHTGSRCLCRAVARRGGLRSTRPPSKQAARTSAPQASALSTTPVTTARSYSIQTATTSRPSSTALPDSVYGARMWLLGRGVHRLLRS